MKNELDFKLLNYIPDPVLPNCKPLCQIKNYILFNKIGQGTFSKVYLSIDINTNKKYAVKRISLNVLKHYPNVISQLDREIRLLNKFNHENIQKMIEVLMSKTGRYIYLVLEYAECGSIESLLDKGNVISIKSIRSIIKQITNALNYIHSKKYVHQDIKPGNILLNSKGKAILCDFGIGHTFGSANMVVGSPAYQAPEAIKDSSDDDSNDDKTLYEKEDIWSLGVTLYKMLFNKLPFNGKNLFEIIENIKVKPLLIPKSNFEVPEKLLRGMLQINPHQRYSLEDVMNDPFVKYADDSAHDLVIINQKPIEISSNIVKIEVTNCKIDSFLFQNLINPKEMLFNKARPISLPSPLVGEVQSEHSFE